MVRRAINLKSDANTHTRNLIGIVFFTVLFLATVIGVFLILQPYMHAIIMAGLLASVFYPVHRWILTRVGERKTLAAALSVVLVALVVVVPIGLFTTSLVMRGIEAYDSVKHWVQPVHHDTPPHHADARDDAGQLIDPDLEAALNTYGEARADTSAPDPTPVADSKTVATDIPLLSANGSVAGFQVSDEFLRFKAQRIDPLLNSELGQKVVRFQQEYYPWETPDPSDMDLKSTIIKSVRGWGEKLPQSGLALAGNLFTVVMSFVIMLFVMFYFFRNGPDWVDRVLDFSPLDEAHENQLLDNIKKVARSSILGTLLTALAQGALGSVAFAIAGIPWLFYGVLMGFCSMIPVVGTALIWVPAVIYLLFVGQTGMAIFLTVWCVVVVGMSDNFLRPYLMQGDTGMSSAILFFAILGGINLFGLIGVIYGPLIFGICWVLLQIYNISTRLPDVPNPAVSQPALAAGGSGGDATATRSEPRLPQQEPPAHAADSARDGAAPPRAAADGNSAPTRTGRRGRRKRK